MAESSPAVVVSQSLWSSESCQVYKRGKDSCRYILLSERVVTLYFIQLHRSKAVCSGQSWVVLSNNDPIILSDESVISDLMSNLIIRAEAQSRKCLLNANTRELNVPMWAMTMFALQFRQWMSVCVKTLVKTVWWYTMVVVVSVHTWSALRAQWWKWHGGLAGMGCDGMAWSGL